MSKMFPLPTSRRSFVCQTAGLLAAAALPPWLAKAAETQPGARAASTAPKSRLILLGTGGGPSPKTIAQLRLRS